MLPEGDANTSFPLSHLEAPPGYSRRCAVTAYSQVHERWSGLWHFQGRPQNGCQEAQRPQMQKRYYTNDSADSSAPAAHPTNGYCSPLFAGSEGPVWGHKFYCLFRFLFRWILGWYQSKKKKKKKRWTTSIGIMVFLTQKLCREKNLDRTLFKTLWCYFKWPNRCFKNSISVDFSYKTNDSLTRDYQWFSVSSFWLEDTLRRLIRIFFRRDAFH